MFSQGIPINLKNCTQISIGNKVIMNSTYYNLHSFSLICDCLSSLEKNKFGFKYVWSYFFQFIT